MAMLNNQPLYAPKHIASIEVKNLTFCYPGTDRVILDNISFKMEAGDIISILGPNGAGKSTLMNCMAGILKPTSGKVLLDGQDMHHLHPREIAKHMAYVPQKLVVNYDYSVFEYLLLGRAAHLRLAEKPGKRDKDIVASVLQLTGLHPYADNSIRDLSGGELQMVSIARLLVQHSGVVLFDEPTSALDLGNQMRVMSIVETLNDAGFGVAMTTHAPDHPLLLGGKVVLLDSDGSFEFGSASKILTEERLSALYRTPMVIEKLPRANRFICVAKSHGSEFVGFELSRSYKK